MGKNPKIEVINIGSELLLHKLNTDIILISNILLKHSFRISKCIIVGDSKEGLPGFKTTIFSVFSSFHR